MNIEFHYTYIILAISFVLTGHFSNLIIFTSIIIIHELGHYIIAKITNLTPVKIIIYPYGGITKLNHLINVKITRELLVALSGIIFQTIYYIIIVLLYKNNYIREYIFSLFTKYHYSILIFNLLPIHPLDGSKIINLIISIFLPYKICSYINVILSLITLLILITINYYQFNYTTILIIMIIINNLTTYYKDINYMFNKFLLERYLYNIKYKKNKVITKITNMYKEKNHIIKENNQYITEKQFLNAHFKEKI